MNDGEYVTAWVADLPDVLTPGEEIVRCRDCKHYADNMEECMKTNEWDDSTWFAVEPDGFCAWGERRES